MGGRGGQGRGAWIERFGVEAERRGCWVRVKREGGSHEGVVGRFRASEWGVSGRGAGG